MVKNLSSTSEFAIREREYNIGKRGVAMSVKNLWIGLMAWSMRLPAAPRAILSLVTGLGFLSFVSAALILPVMAENRLGVQGFLPVWLASAIGIPLLAFGSILTTWSVALFIWAKGTPVPLNPPPRLVTDGPYAYSRNPMLGGIFMMFFGAGALLNSAALFFIVTPVLVIAARVFVKNVEEPELETRLGRDYMEYRKKTPMFFPRFFKP